MIKKIQSLFLSFALIITSFIGLGQVATTAYSSLLFKIKLNYIALVYATYNFLVQLTIEIVF